MINLNSINLNSVNLGGLELSGVKLGYPSLGAFDPASFDQAWTVTGKTNDDEDRATIKNLAGNGNDLTLSNFAFAENSGYGLYQLDFTSSDFRINNMQAEYYNGNKVVLNSLVNAVQIQYFNTNINIRLKVTGLDINACRMSVYDNINNSKMQVYHNDGIFDINYKANEGANRIYFYVLGASGKINPITIEQIPDYEGYLVTDGVVDKIASKNRIRFNENWTMVGNWAFIESGTTSAGIVKSNQIYIYEPTNGIRIYLRQGQKAYISPAKLINAITSNGKMYDENWNEYDINPMGSDVDSENGNFLNLGFFGSNYCKFAFKNLAIYNRVLTKDQCIKAYDYLQTLKEK